MIYLFIIVLLITIDLQTKHYVENNIALNSSKEIVKNKFYLLHIKNEGAAYGFLKNNPILLLVTTNIAFCFVLFSFIKSLKTPFIHLKFAYSLILSGAIANIYDRIKKKHVTDFIFIKFNKNAPVFNFADIFIFIGCLLILVKSLIGDE